MSSSPTQVAGSAAPRVTNDEVRAVLHTHIRKTARFIKFLDLCVYLFAWVAAMFGLWLLACVVDHWLAPLSSLGRWVIWISAVAGTAWWLATQLIPLLFQRINPAYAAKRIEHLLPEFKNGLISWLELDQMQENGVPRGIMSALTYRAARFIGGQDPSTTVDTSRLIKLVGVVLLLFTSLVVYTMVSPKSVLDTGKRIAMPWRTIAAPSRVQILSVKPGAVELTQGKPLEVDVELRGIRTGEAVRVRFTTTDGQLRDQRVDLTPVSEGYHYSGKVRTETTGVEHELDYWVEAGDAISGPYRVSLSPLPSVVLEQVELKFPAYTKIADRKVSGGDFEAIEGTRATLHALANQKMSRGRWEINPEIDAAGELTRAEAVHELSVEDRQLTGTLLLQLNSEKENPTKLTYRLRGFNQRGDGNREPILHAMKVIADVGPEIKLVGPENRRVKVRPTSRLNLEVQANDPDFGLSQIDIEIRHSAIVVRRESLLKSEGAIGQQIKRLPINMADFKIAEGGTLEVRAFAQDNRHDPVSERLAPNAKESELLTLEVVGADQQAAPDEEPVAASDEAAKGNGKSEKNEQAGNESNRPNSNVRDSNNRNGENNEPKQNDPNGADQPQAPQNPNDKSKEPPRQNQNSNPAEPKGNRDKGEQDSQGKQEGKQEGKQQNNQAGKQADQSKPEEGKQKPGKNGAGQQGGAQAGNQDAEEQEGAEQGSQPGAQQGSKFGGNESTSDGKQSDSSSGSSSKNDKPQSGSGKSGNEPSNSIGQKSSSPSSNSSKGSSGAKGSSGSESSSDSKSDSSNQSGAPNASGEGSKPSDGEVVKRVQEFMEEKNSQSNPDQSNSAQKGEGAGNDSKSASNNGATGENSKSESAKRDDTKRDGDKGDGATGENAKDGSDSIKNNSPSSKGEKSDATNGTGQANRDQSETKSNFSDRDGKQSSQSENKGSEVKQAPDAKDDKSTNGNNSDSNASNGQGSEGKSSEGKGSEGKGSEGKGSEGKGSEGKGSEGKGSEGKGSEGKGSEGKGSQGKGSEGKGTAGTDAQGKPESNSQNGPSSKSGSQAQQNSEKEGSSKSAQGGQNAQGKDGAQGEQSSGEKGAKGEQGGGGSEAGKPSGSSEGGGKANNSKTGKSGSSGSGTGNGEGGGEGKADETNQEYANRTTQMVLDYLNRQKEQPDPELLRELNWSEDDLRKFTERWNRARNLAASPNPEDQKKWTEMLEDLGLDRQTVKPSAANSVDDNFQQMRDSGTRTRPPENLRKQYEAFRRAFEKTGK